MKLITLDFQGGPQDGSHERVRGSTLSPGEIIERRFPSLKPKSKRKIKEHLYQSQTPWKPAEKQVVLQYLGLW